MSCVAGGRNGPHSLGVTTTVRQQQLQPTQPRAVCCAVLTRLTETRVSRPTPERQRLRSGWSPHPPDTRHCTPIYLSASLATLRLL